MLAIAISLLIGLAAAIALKVTYVSARHALAAYVRLSAELAALDRPVRVAVPVTPAGRARRRYAAA